MVSVPRLPRASAVRRSQPRPYVTPQPTIEWTGAPLRCSDGAAITLIVADAQASGYRMRLLIHGVDRIDLFRRK